jgi:hypothetical protein
MYRLVSYSYIYCQQQEKRKTIQVHGFKPLTGIVVSLALATAAELHLVALEVSAVFDDFQETHDCSGLGYETAGKYH